MAIPPWVSDPAGSAAREIAPLYWIMFAAAVVVLAVVLAALVYSGVRFRERPGLAARQFHGHNRLELLWTVIPTIMVITLTLLSFQRLLVLNEVEAGTEMAIKVEARQFAFTFTYPDEPMFRTREGTPLSTVRELHVPVGTRVRLEITSTDVIHSFAVPKLGGKKDAVPGRMTYLQIEADRPGEFKGQCFEFCGDGHADMLITAVVHPREEYAAWARQAVAAADLLLDPATKEGRELFVRGACAGCHTIQGLTAGRAPGAPDLTRIASRPTIAGVLPMNEENLARWIAKPSAVKPATPMPDLGLDQDTVSKIVKFLLTQK